MVIVRFEMNFFLRVVLALAGESFFEHSFARKPTTSAGFNFGC